MTAIAGLIEGGTVWMGGDAAGTINGLLITATGSKVLLKKDTVGQNWLFGHSGTRAILTVLEFGVEIPPIEIEESIPKFLFQKLIPHIKEALRKANLLKTVNGVA